MTIKKKVVMPSGLGKVMFRYMPRRVYGITNPKHVLYDGKNDSSIDTFYVLRDETGRWKLSLSETEENWIMDELNLDPGDLNTNDKNNEYLKSIAIEMPKHGISLNTERAFDLLTERVLIAYNNVFSPNSKSKKNKASYRYVRLKENEETQIYLEEADLKKTVYKLLGKLEDSRERMIMYILNTKVRLNPRIPTSDLRKMVNISAERDPKVFTKTLDDPLFTEKGLLNMGVILKVIEIKSNFYYYDDIPLAFEGTVATLQNAATFLADKTNGDINLAISEKVLNEFNRAD